MVTPTVMRVSAKSPLRSKLKMGPRLPAQTASALSKLESQVSKATNLLASLNLQLLSLNSAAQGPKIMQTPANNR